MPPTAKGEITGRHVLWGMIAFFGVIFAVNGWFLYSALSTHTGVVAVEPYRKGLAYNDRIAADERQHALGWTSSVSLDVAAGKLDVALADRTGAPLGGLDLRGMIGRPSTVEHDAKLEFREAAPGRYEARLAGIEAGTWLLQLEAAHLTSAGEEILWRHRQRLWAKP